MGKGSPAPVTLGVGKKAVIALRYSEFNGKGPDTGTCVLVTAGAADVVAPGDSTEAGPRWWTAPAGRRRSPSAATRSG